MEPEPTMEQMVKCLKDADMYDASLAQHVLVDYYKAIKNSEKSLREEEAEKSLNESVNELEEAINHSESLAPSPMKRQRFNENLNEEDSLSDFSQDFLVEQKPPRKGNYNHNNNQGETSQNSKGAQLRAVDVDNRKFGYSEMPKIGDIPLKIHNYKPKFVNIFNSKDFQMASSAERIEMLCNFHIAQNKLLSQYARLSTNMAPKPKPITVICEYHEVKPPNPVISSLKEEASCSGATAYISRSGRLTKRRAYEDFTEDDEDFVQDSSSTFIKRSKMNDQGWLSKTATKGKSGKAAALKQGSASNNNNVSELESNIRSESPDSSQNELFQDEFDRLLNSGVNQKPARLNASKRKASSNEEIMSRSSLFQDHETPKKSRTGALLNKALEEAERHKQEQEETRKFTSTLEVDSQDLDDDVDDEIIDVEEERRRIVPPLPRVRKSIHPTSNKVLEPLSITTTKRPPGTPALVNGNGRKTAVSRASKASLNFNNNNEDRAEASSSSGSSKGKTTMCPLCSLSFPQKDIENHASTCGDDLFPQTTQHQRITCEICDAVVPFGTGYEVHVKECTSKKRQN